MTVDLVTHRCTVTPYRHIILNAFHGGKRGRCVQVTTHKDYVQMTFKEAIDFFRTCISEIEKLDAEYNRNPPWWETMGERVEK